MARAGLTPETVTTLALEVLDASGEPGLTLRAVAERAGVATPSLYKHVPGLGRLRELMAVRTLDDAAGQLGTAVMGRAGEDALRAFLAGYRAFAREYPHRQTLVERIRSTDPEVLAASERLTRIAFAVVRGFGLEGEQAVHAVRTLRAAVVGFVGLERDSGYQLSVGTDESFEFLTRVLARGLREGAGGGGTAAADSAGGRVGADSPISA